MNKNQHEVLVLEPHAGFYYVIGLKFVRNVYFDKTNFRELSRHLELQM
jgi:hypothetical protein